MQTVIDFTNGDSGYVKKQGLTYSVGYGWGNCSIEKNPLIQSDKRAVFRFLTAGIIPTDAIVSLVEFKKVDATAQPVNPSLSSDLLLGAWCGATLDASANDWSGGNSMNLDVLIYADGTWVDLADGGQDPTILVNLDVGANGGNTDLLIKDTSVSPNATGHSFNKDKSKCQLRITYTTPSGIHTKTLLGVGL